MLKEHILGQENEIRLSRVLNFLKDVALRCAQIRC